MVDYSARLLSVFTILYVRSLELNYYLLQVCTLKLHLTYLPHLLCPGNHHFTLFLQVWLFRLNINDTVVYLSSSVLFHLAHYKWQDVLLFHGWITLYYNIYIYMYTYLLYLHLLYIHLLTSIKLISISWLL